MPEGATEEIRETGISRDAALTYLGGRILNLGTKIEAAREKLEAKR